MSKTSTDNEYKNVLAPTSDGEEAFPTHLDLHAGLPTQVGILSSRDEFKNPFTAIDRTDKIEFNISCNKDEIIDPYNTFIYTESQILDEGGHVIPVQVGGPPLANNAAAKITFVNGLSSAWFKNCSVKLNNTLICPGDGLYMYRADIENRLFYSKQVKENCMRNNGYYHDVPNWDHAFIAEKAFHADTCLDSLKARWKMSNNSKLYKCFGRIHSELFDQTKLLPPDSRVDIVFTKNDNTDFMILTGEEAVNYKVKLITCKLLVRYLKIDPDIINEMDLVTNRGENMKFPLRKVEMSFYTKSQNNADFSEQNLIKEGNNLPRRLFIAFVKQDAFHGNKNLDPFNYRACNIRQVTLRLGGQVRPYPELTCSTNIPGEEDTILPLTALLQTVGAFYSNEKDIGIHRDNYHQGNFILGFDLTSGGVQAGEAFELPKKESASLEIKLSGAGMPAPYSMIVYAEYDAELQVDKSNNVYLF